MVTVDIYEILGIENRENTYTNLIKFLFETEEDFKTKFLSKLNINTDDLNNFKISAHKIVKFNNQTIEPDLIIYNQKDNLLKVIEVKILSGQGTKQLERYYAAKEEIIKSFNMDINSNTDFIYLALNNDLTTQDIKEGWKFISWGDIADLFNGDYGHDELTKPVYKRANSLNDDFSYNTIKDKTVNYVMDEKSWYREDKRFLAIMKSSDKFKNYNIDTSYKYQKNQNSIVSKFVFHKIDKERHIPWKSKKELPEEKIDSVSSIVEKCYDLHVELDVEQTVENIILYYRLDHHFNPYHKTKELDSKFGNTTRKNLNNTRQMFFKSLKLKPELKESKEQGFYFNRTQGNYLSIIKKEVKYCNQISIEELIKDISKEVKYLSNLIDNIILPIELK